MEFIEWWFAKHWFWSTLLTPGMCFAFACFKGLTVRAIVALFWLIGASSRAGGQ